VKHSALWGTGNRGGEHRSSALWGTGNRGGEHRSNALWGSGRGRSLVTATVAALALIVPLGATAGNGNGYLTRYAHNDRNTIEEGTAVRAGDVIAKMGSTGRSTGVHVHFEVWQKGKLVNPSQYVRAMRTARG
jgi:murein DD-endopeptidase MepM/ murein hydrolase activator NlpD